MCNSHLELTRHILVPDVKQTRREREEKGKDTITCTFKASSFRDLSHKTTKNSSRVIMQDIAQSNVEIILDW